MHTRKWVYRVEAKFKFVKLYVFCVFIYLCISWHLHHTFAAWKLKISHVGIYVYEIYNIFSAVQIIRHEANSNFGNQGRAPTKSPGANLNSNSSKMSSFRLRGRRSCLVLPFRAAVRHCFSKWVNPIIHYVHQHPCSAYLYAYWLYMDDVSYSGIKTFGVYMCNRLSSLTAASLLAGLNYTVHSYINAYNVKALV